MYCLVCQMPDPRKICEAFTHRIIQAVCFRSGCWEVDYVYSMRLWLDHSTRFGRGFGVGGNGYLSIIPRRSSKLVRCFIHCYTIESMREVDDVPRYGHSPEVIHQCMSVRCILHSATRHCSQADSTYL